MLRTRAEKSFALSSSGCCHTTALFQTVKASTLIASHKFHNNSSNSCTFPSTSTMSDDTKTIIDYFEANVKKFGDRRFMIQPMGGGDDNIKYYTFNEVMEEAKKMAGYIESLNYPPKSQIAICSKNCAWWIIADLAIWM
jgi:AMP-binding enzyme